MSNQEIKIRKGTVDEVVEVSRQIPEFDDPYDQNAYQERLAGKEHLILIACHQDTPVGFKVGYDKFQNGSFYSWMGGIVPGYRRIGIARQLADYQENYTREKGYGHIILKTRNRHKSMLIFSLKNGFIIESVEPRLDELENRIVMRKTI